jgi:hypothetical protein
MLVLNRNNIRTRTLGKAIERASATLVAAGFPVIQPGVTNHSLRRTSRVCCTRPVYPRLRDGADEAHLVGAGTGGVRAKMARSRDTGARMDALTQGAD